MKNVCIYVWWNSKADTRINHGHLIITISYYCSHANDNINMKDRELKSLRRQLDTTSEDLSENSRGKEVALRENRRLQDDLAVMTRENQVRWNSWSKTWYCYLNKK